MQIHVRIVWDGESFIMRLTVLQVNAPQIPERVTMTFMRARAELFMPRVVLAKRIAVPLTVATASEIMNQAARKSRTSLRRRARSMVR